MPENLNSISSYRQIGTFPAPPISMISVRLNSPEVRQASGRVGSSRPARREAPGQEINLWSSPAPARIVLPGVGAGWERCGERFGIKDKI